MDKKMNIAASTPQLSRDDYERFQTLILEHTGLLFGPRRQDGGEVQRRFTLYYFTVFSTSVTSPREKTPQIPPVLAKEGTFPRGNCASMRRS